MNRIKKYFKLMVVLSLVIWSVRMIYPAYVEYSKTRLQLYEIEKKLLEQQKKNENVRIRNHKLKTDLKEIERVAREKFGWSKSGEKIYDFSNLPE